MYGHCESVLHHLQGRNPMEVFTHSSSDAVLFNQNFFKNSIIYTDLNFVNVIFVVHLCTGHLRRVSSLSLSLFKVGLNSRLCRPILYFS